MTNNRQMRSRRHIHLVTFLLVQGHVAQIFGFQQAATKFPTNSHKSKWKICISSTGPQERIKTSRNATSGNKSSESSRGARVERKIQEMYEREKNSGEQLSQDYCDKILGYCVAADEWDSVLDVIEAMKRQGLAQERSTYRACLVECAKVGNGASAKEILNAMKQALVEPEPYDISLAIGAICRNGKHEPASWQQALALLKTEVEEIKSSSNVVPVEGYDAILSAMTEAKQWKEAVRLIRQMEGELPHEGLHSEPSVASYRSAIECCVRAGQAEQAVQLLHAMNKRGLIPTTYTFELVVSSLAKKLQWRRALQLLAMMTELNVPKNVALYNTVISSCAKAREVGMAKNLLSKMRREGIPPNIYTFNSVISACAGTSRWQDALNLVDQCNREPGLTPDIYTYTNAMRACARGGKTRRALSLLQVVKDKGLPVDSYCYTAVIDACAKAKMWKKALSLLDEMKDRGVEPTHVTYSVVISACGNGGQWEKALELLDLMQNTGMPVNLITYNACITALSKASRQYARHSSENTSNEISLWKRASSLLKHMKEDGIEPDGFSYSAAISCCGAEGRWEEALELMEQMRQGGARTRPNKVSYTAAITACGRAGKAEDAIRLFRIMKKEGLSPDRIAYNALFSALRVAGDSETTFELWKEICGTRATPKGRIATAVATPDIVTVTECIATLSRAGQIKHVDKVFAEAVERRIVLRGGLDVKWELDLSGMSFPVARAACRYIINGARSVPGEKVANLDELVLITGVGKAHQNRTTISSSTAQNETTSLRDYIQEILETDFEPPIPSHVPRLAQGTVVVQKDDLLDWMTSNGKMIT